MPRIPTEVGLREEEDLKFEASLGYTGKFASKSKQTK
jgi:hypothetical protein